MRSRQRLHGMHFKVGVALLIFSLIVPQQFRAQQEETPRGVPPGFLLPQPPGARPKPAAQPEAAKPAEQAPQATQVAQAQATPQEAAKTTGVLNLHDASLVEVIDALCRQLQINYILDPRVKGTVTLNTYGEVREIDLRSLLDLILRINGAAMVKVGNIYRIVPLAEASRLPIPPEVDPKQIPEDDQLMLNLVFLKYASVQEVAKLLEPFIGEGAATWAYPPANLLLVLDSRRNMRRTMELISMFDSDVLTNQRVRIFEVKHGRPSDLASELETIMKSISLSQEAAPVRFLPINRLNLIIAIAPNPGVFERVEAWLKRLDQPQQVTVGTVDNYVYRVRYRRAEALAAAIMELYWGTGYGYMYGYGGYGLFSGVAGTFGSRYLAPAAAAYAPYGGYSGAAMYRGFAPYGPMGAGGLFQGPGAYAGAPFGGYAGETPVATGTQPGAQQTAPAVGGAGGVAGRDLTGTYLGYGPYGYGVGLPRVVPNLLDNTLLIQGTPQHYQQILKLLEQLDTPPRQVLIDAKIYEVSLTGAFASGVAAFLQKLGGGTVSVPTRQPVGSATADGLRFSIGTLVGKSRELLAFLEAKENRTRARVLSAPSVIATDSIPASINVGTEVPTLTAQAVTPIQAGGTSLFTNTIQNRRSGVTLNILAQVNPTGIVTLIIDQEVSAPLPPPAGGIQSPSFSTRTVQTQVTVRDGDTIAIGGIINHTDTYSSAGVPLLHRIPILGHAFGAKSRSHERTELVVFMTPHVIYDTDQVLDATWELRTRFQKLQRLIQE